MSVYTSSGNLISLYKSESTESFPTSEESVKSVLFDEQLDNNNKSNSNSIHTTAAAAAVAADSVITAAINPIANSSSNGSSCSGVCETMKSNHKSEHSIKDNKYESNCETRDGKACNQTYQSLKLKILKTLAEESSSFASPVQSVVDGSEHTVNFSVGCAAVPELEKEKEQQQQQQQQHERFNTPERNRNKANLSRYVREQINGHNNEYERYTSDYHLRRLWSAPPKLRDALTSPLIHLYATTHQNRSMGNGKENDINNSIWARMMSSSASAQQNPYNYQQHYNYYHRHNHHHNKQQEEQEQQQRQYYHQERYKHSNSLSSFATDMDAKVQRRGRGDVASSFQLASRTPLTPMLHTPQLQVALPALTATFTSEPRLHPEDSMIADAIETLVQWKKPFKPVYFRDWYIYHYCSEESVKRLGLVQKCAGKLTWLFSWYLQAWSMTGEAEFYTLFLPTLVWVGRPLDGLQIASLLCMGQYLTSAIKDAICCPRPPCPPLELRGKRVTHDTEYGFPSTHSCHSGMFAYFLYCELIQLLPHNPVVCWLIAFLFFVHVSFSRIYLGMHWFGDLVGGWLAAFICVLFHVAFVNHWEELLISIHMAPWWAFLLVYVALHLLAICHPVPHDACPCYVDSMRFAGALAGGVIGFWLFQRQFHSITARPVADSLRKVHLTWFFIVEWLVCIAVVLLGEEATSRALKWALQPVFTFLSGAYAYKMHRVFRKPYLIMAKVIGLTTRGNAHGTTRFYPWNPNNSFVFMRNSTNNSAERERKSMKNAENRTEDELSKRESRSLERGEGALHMSSATIREDKQSVENPHINELSVHHEVKESNNLNFSNVHDSQNNSNNNNNNNNNDNVHDNTSNDVYSVAEHNTSGSSITVKNNNNAGNNEHNATTEHNDQILGGHNGTKELVDDVNNGNFIILNGSHKEENCSQSSELKLNPKKNSIATTPENNGNFNLVEHEEQYCQEQKNLFTSVQSSTQHPYKNLSKPQQAKQREEEELELHLRRNDYNDAYNYNGNFVNGSNSSNYNINGIRNVQESQQEQHNDDNAVSITIYNDGDANGEQHVYDKSNNKQNRGSDDNNNNNNKNVYVHDEDNRHDDRAMENNASGDVVEVPDGYIHPRQV